MSKAINIHDKFVKAILSDRDVAIDYFKGSLPASISAQLDFSTLTQLSGSYLSKELEETMSDILYSCKRIQDEQEVKVSLLIEHKSYRDKNTPIQIGSYIFSALQRQMANKEKLSVVIPILFYHGADNWKYTTILDLFETLPSEWRHFVPNFDYVYNDLSAMPDEDLRALSNQFLAACMLTLKHYLDDDWLDEHAIGVFNLAADASGNLLNQFAVYFLKNSKADKARIVEILDFVSEPIKDKIMSTLDLFKSMGLDEGREIGIKIGRQEGHEEGLKKARLEIVTNLIKDSALTDEQIATVTSISTGFVTDLRIKLTSK